MLLCCWLSALKCIFPLLTLTCFPHADRLDHILTTHAFSHFPNAHCLHCLLPQGRKKRALPPLRGKKGQAESGADRTKPLLLWCVYRGRVTGMKDRGREKERETPWGDRKGVIPLNAHKYIRYRLNKPIHFVQVPRVVPLFSLPLSHSLSNTHTTHTYPDMLLNITRHAAVLRACLFLSSLLRPPLRPSVPPRRRQALEQDKHLRSRSGHKLFFVAV